MDIYFLHLTDHLGTDATLASDTLCTGETGPFGRSVSKQVVAQFER
jgi:hypothetical protein